MAVARARPAGNSWATRASETANMAAPPMPWSARATFRNVASGATAQSADAAEKTARPAENTRLRPSASASEPAVRTRAARESVGVDHPLHVAEAGPEVVADRRERHVDDRDVEQQHERRHRDG